MEREGAADATDIVGNYTVVETKVSASCEIPDAGESNLTIRNDEDGVAVLLPGLSGACPGNLDSATCRFTAECRLFDEKNPTETTATFNVDYTFAGRTFSGSLVFGKLSAPACTATLRQEGQRI
ncbi:MAG: hypothetical protein KIS78_19065 [Labilithrix sp.]|nr:hypothetical protein [Labilithrix sp.]